MAKRRIIVGLSAVLFVTALMSGIASVDLEPPTQAEATALVQKGNFKDALGLLQKRLLDPKTDPKQVGADLEMAIQCLYRLGRNPEIDPLRNQALEVHGKNWRFLQAAARSFIEGDSRGFIVSGKFERGGVRRGGGNLVSAFQRDRVMTLRLLNQGLELALKDDQRSEVSDYLVYFAQAMLHGEQGQQAWRLQDLTDWTKLPDYEPWVWRNSYDQHRSAAVDANGDPIYHHKPKTLADAKSDGERWRYLMDMAVEIDPSRKPLIRKMFAQFLRDQFDVHTMSPHRSTPWNLARNVADDNLDQNQEQAGPFAVHTLADDETIARLATGVKRFKLPDEFNFIKIYREVAETDPVGDHASQAYEALANIFTNRRQYPKAAAEWRLAIARHGKGGNEYRQRALEQIINNWGRFETTRNQPAGQGATLNYRFRNGKRVEFKAFPIQMDLLFADAKAYLKTKPENVNYLQYDVENLGLRLVSQDQTKYLKPATATWSLDLKPRANHVDDLVTVSTPLQKAGAYLITAVMDDGNVARTILFVDDLAIVQKVIDKQTLYFVCDAVTGKPVPNANVEFVGFKITYNYQRNQQPRQTFDFANFSEASDSDGLIVPDPIQMPANYQWIAAARVQGKTAYLGLRSVYRGVSNNNAYNQVKTYFVTDRPVYRPEQTVRFKTWIRRATYREEGDGREFANQDFTVSIYDPQGKEIQTKVYKTDEYGGFDGSLELGSNAALGVYYLRIPRLGQSSFRVEEYKKPEFEVTVEAPKKPLKLGEKFEALIKAKYYFGSPVTKAKVAYKVTRTSKDISWYPTGDWDWFYGSGYWWFGQDYQWYPGFRSWGCFRPSPWWYNRPSTPPELIAQGEVAIGADGTYKLVIDTAEALANHSDQDHEYRIEAEVTDKSRRVITGSGQVITARKPFQVYAWSNRGHYQTKDTIRADFQARTPDGKPVEGKGQLRLHKISYDAKGTPTETEVLVQNLDTNPEGRATLQLKADQAGQYRVSLALTYSEGHKVEGAHIYLVRGDNFDGGEFQFNDLELTPEKREYKPGEKVRLAINTKRADSTVLLFVKPVNGIATAPQIVKIPGKSTVVEIPVKQEDMPNFFIEAVTVANAKVHNELREVVVPPIKKVINVDVKPSKQEYLPGEKATFQITLTDSTGERIKGSTVVSIYDKSVEYISGGSNVPEIRDAFWKWRRRHNPGADHSLNRSYGNFLRTNETSMTDLGLFGSLALLMPDAAEKMASVRTFSNSAGRGGFGGAPGGVPAMAKSAPMFGRDAAEESEDFFKAKDKKSSDALPELGYVGFAGAQQPVIRSSFADTAYWNGSLITAQDGSAEVELKMPENLTGWKARVWAMGDDVKVGEGVAEVVTVKNVLVRLQAPRFFVETDEVVLSANIRNGLKTDKNVQAILEFGDSSSLQMLDPGQKTIMIKAGSETRVDWKVKVVHEGEAIVRMKALTDEESDAMEMKFPVFVHGMLKTDSYSGQVRPKDDEASITINIPEKRKAEQSRLEIRYSPTLAGAMIDAIPYLADYPYGCTEQTLNRFLPTVIVQNTLKRMNVDLASIRDKRVNLNAQEIGDAQKRVQRWKRYERDPVFDQKEMDLMVKVGVADLAKMQNADGGWGWFSGNGERSYPHTTAVVVHGLQIAKANGIAIVPGVLERGVEWLKSYQAEQISKILNGPAQRDPYKEHADDTDALVFMILNDADSVDATMRDFLDRDRTRLSLYAVAMYGIALQKQGQAEKLASVMDNLKQYLVIDDENQTAHLKLPNQGYWWSWHGSEIETMAFYLKLLTKTDPQGDVAPKLVKYLLNNRKNATYWNSTRDTAYCIEAFADYIAATGEDQPNMTVEVFIDGEKHKSVQIDSKNLFSFDNALILEGVKVPPGKHQVTLRKQGHGPLYFNVYATNFTLEDRITKAGLEVKVERKYYKLVQKKAQSTVSGNRGQVLKQEIVAYDRLPLEDLATLKSGELVEVELELASKNDYEYLLFEDFKPAGFEPVEVRSGYNGNEMGAYVEFRDEKVAFFVRALARGNHSVSYRLRAEIPGKFSALPAAASGMYAPELRGNSDEFKVRVED